MKKYWMLLLVLWIGLTLGLAAKGKTPPADNQPPAWIDNPQSIYPDNMYLCALGEGDTRKEAESDATANLSRIFESKVQVDETTRTRLYELEQNGVSKTENETELNQNVGIQSSQTLLNVQIGESYCDSRGRYHVIAYLDRLKTGEVYESKIEGYSAEIVQWSAKADTTKDIVKRYAYRNAASLLATENSVLSGQLAIISPATKEFVDLPYDPAKVKTSMMDAAQALTVSVSIQGDDEGKILMILKGALADQGFTVQDGGVLTLTGQVGFEPVELNDGHGTHYVRWTLGMDMKNQQNTILVSLYDKGREGHLNADEAKARCYRTIESRIQNVFMQKLNAYFDGFVTK